MPGTEDFLDIILILSSLDSQKMDTLDTLDAWLREIDRKVDFHHQYGTDKFEFRINFELADLDGLVFFSKPFELCETAAELVDGSGKDLTHPVAGRILSGNGSILFEFFPGTYGFRASFSWLSESRYVELTGGWGNFEERAKDILGPGWSDTTEDRFTKFELLREKFSVKAEDALYTVRTIEKELAEGQRSGSPNAGSHLSDHYTWYQNGLSTCQLILAKYGNA